MLGANVTDAATGRTAAFLKPAVIKEVKGRRIAIFGLLTDKMEELALPRRIAGLRFTDPVEEARRQVERARSQKADLVIALTHQGFPKDTYLASRVSGIDLIIGGRSHTAVDPAYRDPRTGTLVVQAGANLERVGKVALEVGPRGPVRVEYEGSGRQDVRLRRVWVNGKAIENDRQYRLRCTGASVRFGSART